MNRWSWALSRRLLRAHQWPPAAPQQRQQRQQTSRPSPQGNWGQPLVAAASWRAPPRAAPSPAAHCGMQTRTDQPPRRKLGACVPTLLYVDCQFLVPSGLPKGLSHRVAREQRSRSRSLLAGAVAYRRAQGRFRKAGRHQRCDSRTGDGPACAAGVLVAGLYRRRKDHSGAPGNCRLVQKRQGGLYKNRTRVAVAQCACGLNVVGRIENWGGPGDEVMQSTGEEGRATQQEELHTGRLGWCTKVQSDSEDGCRCSTALSRQHERHSTAPHCTAPAEEGAAHTQAEMG